MCRWYRRFCLGLILTWTGIAHGGDVSNEKSVPPQKSADAPHADSEETPVSGHPNLKTQTLGGVQFWGDVAFFHGWHIQQNIFSKHYRLLDGDDVRHAWGTRQECEAKLHEIRDRLKLPPMKGKAVIVLHGLGRSDKSVMRMRRYFAQQGYLTIAMNYPSLRANLKQNANYLHQVIDSLEGVETVHLVGFSLGGIVIRQCLADYDVPKLGRVVFIGSPHHGAELATRFKDWWAFKTIAGPSGQELATAPYGAAANLPSPQCEFGIIAGCRGSDEGYNPLIPGDDDGLVSLESTRLPGAKDFLTFYAMHQSLIHTPDVYQAAERFLADGQFREDGEAQPVPLMDREGNDQTRDEANGEGTKTQPQRNGGQPTRSAKVPGVTQVTRPADGERLPPRTSNRKP